jgi:hypothetical protein
MLLMKKRPQSPSTSRSAVNGTFTGTISPWVNAGKPGTGNKKFVYESNNIRATVVATDGDTQRLRIPFLTENGVTYSYTMDLDISSFLSSFVVRMGVMNDVGGNQQIVLHIPVANGVVNLSGSFVANGSYTWLYVVITENVA